MTNPPDPKTKTPRTDAKWTDAQVGPNGGSRNWSSVASEMRKHATQLELENQSLTRRLEEAEENLENCRIIQREHLANSIAKGKQLTALRTAAEALEDGAAALIEAIQITFWSSFDGNTQVEATAETLREDYNEGLGNAFEKTQTALAALRAELENK